MNWLCALIGGFCLLNIASLAAEVGQCRVSMQQEELGNNRVLYSYMCGNSAKYLD